MTSLEAVLAVGPRRIVGRADGRLPWRISADLAHFASITAERCLLVGRVTFENLPPLDGRRLVVVTTRPRRVRVDGDRVVAAATSPHDAVDIARRVDATPILAGGASLYEALWDLVGTVWWTDVDRPVAEEPGDVCLPDAVSTAGFARVASKQLAEGVSATRWVR